MNIKVITGGVLEKDGRFLLVEENQKICKGKWNIPAGGLKGITIVALIITILFSYNENLLNQ